MLMVSVAVLVIFGGIVAFVTLQSREDIHGRILTRAAHSIEQVVTSEYRRAEEEALLDNAELIEMDLIDLAISSEQIIDEIALWCLELPDVQSIALHDLQGELRRGLRSVPMWRWGVLLPRAGGLRELSRRLRELPHLW